MGRFLLLIVALFVLIWLVRTALAGRDGAGSGEQARSDDRREDLVPCAHCGVHLPRAESLTASGRHFCSEEHRRLGPREG